MSQGNALRICWAVHSAVGCPVTVDMEDLTAVVGEHDEDPQDPECERWNDEEVDRGELADMIVEEGAPGLRRWRTTTHQVLADRGFGDLDAELEQLAVDPRSAPEREMWSSTFPALCEAGTYVEFA